MELENKPLPEEKAKEKKPFPVKWLLLGLLVLVGIGLIGAGGYLYIAGQQKKAQEESKKSESNKSAEDEAKPAATANFGTKECPTTLTEGEINADLKGWKKMENTKYKFSYYIPGDWKTYVPDTAEGVPEEAFYNDNDPQTGFMNLEYLVDWKANGASYLAYKEVSKTTLPVACSNGTLTTKRVTEQPNLYLLEADFSPKGIHHRVFYFYKSLGGASLDSDFGEQFILLLKTVQSN